MGHARKMKVIRSICMSVAVGVVFSGLGLAQEKGEWRPASKPAQSITGQVAFSASRMSINFSSYTIAQIREVTPTEISAVFDGADGSKGSGNLYRTDIPGTKKFVGKNTLCGSEDVEYVVTFVSGRELELAFFSGAAAPSLTAESLANASNLCGTYTYVR